MSQIWCGILIAYYFSMSDFQNTDLMSKGRQEILLRNLLADEKADNRLLEWGGRLALENHHWDIAEEIFSCLLERRKNPTDLFCLGESLLNQFRLKEAEECFVESLHQILEPCTLLFKINKYLGQIYLRYKNYPMAEEYYNKAFTLNPHSLSLQFHRALLKLKEKKYKESETLFESIVSKSPESAEAWLGLAINRYFLGDEEIALGCLDRCLDVNPHHVKAFELKQKWKYKHILTPIEDRFVFSA